MKTKLLSMMVLSTGLLSCSQDMPASQVPSIVQNTIQSKFVYATDIEWEKKQDFYEAEFDINKIDYKAHIDANGRLVIYKMNITDAELPAAVITTVRQQHSDYKIDDVDRLEKDGAEYYQVELDGKVTKDLLLVFTADGKPAENISYMP